MTERSQIRRHPERAVHGEAALILAEGLAAHVGFCQDGQPFVIPLAYHYDPAAPTTSICTPPRPAAPCNTSAPAPPRV